MSEYLNYDTASPYGAILTAPGGPYGGYNEFSMLFLGFGIESYAATPDGSAGTVDSALAAASSTSPITTLPLSNPLGPDGMNILAPGYDPATPIGGLIYPTTGSLVAANNDPSSCWDEFYVWVGLGTGVSYLNSINALDAAKEATDWISKDDAASSATSWEWAGDMGLLVMMYGAIYENYITPDYTDSSCAMWDPVSGACIGYENDMNQFGATWGKFPPFQSGEGMWGVFVPHPSGYGTWSPASGVIIQGVPTGPLGG